MAVLIGHAMVPEVESSGIFFVPSLGLDLDYHLSEKWSMGLHSDMELENYRIKAQDGESLEIVTPFVASLDVFYRLNDNLLVGLGPGLTWENATLRTLVRIGIEGEVPLNDRWEWTPTIYLDQRIDGHQVWTIAVGIAHYL